MRVRITPGETALARISGPHSLAVASVKAITAAFAAA